MAAGVPCISSVYAGASHDLIKEGETGFMMDFYDTPAITEKVNYLLNHPDKAQEIGENARNFIANYANPAVSASGFVEAISSL